MIYSSDNLKKNYEKQCKEQRKLNLVKLREKIAKLSQTEFSKRTGIQKTNLSSIEKGDRGISLFIILAYKTFFYENFSMNISVDYLLGYTDIMQNESMDTAKDLHLSNDAINCLKYMYDSQEYSNIDTLNKLMSDKESFNQLLGNIDIILNPNSWKPAICIDYDANEDFCNVEILKKNEYNAFVKTNNENTSLGSLIIDETILESHAQLTIQNILNKYKK